MVDQFLWFVNEYGFQYLAVGMFSYFIITVRFGVADFWREVGIMPVVVLLWPLFIIEHLGLRCHKRYVRIWRK